MFDPGALGTLLIGLDHARDEFDLVPQTRRRPQAATRARVAHARSSVANALRLVAAHVDSRKPATRRGAA